MSSTPPRSHSSASNAQLVDFDEAVVKSGLVGGTRFLRVRGTLSRDGLKAKLAPRIYPRKPEYWVIEVVATPSQNAETRSFELSIPIDSVIGTKGIIVRGETREEMIQD